MDRKTWIVNSSEEEANQGQNVGNVVKDFVIFRARIRW